MNHAPSNTFWIVWLIITFVFLAGMWKTYKKAGQPGWGCLIPIYNIYLLCKMGGKRGTWTLLWIIPVVNIIVAFLVYKEIAKRFNRGVGFAVGLTILSPIFFCILGFDDSQYQA